MKRIINDNLLKSKSAFTLIELLAVIIILGIIMLIAIPSVTDYVETANKETLEEQVHKLILVNYQ